MANPISKGDLVFAAAQLMDTIFEFTETVYETIATSKRFRDICVKKQFKQHQGYSYSYATGTFYAFGKNSEDFMNKLNYSAWVIDYTLAETLSSLFYMVNGMVSPHIELCVNGDMGRSATRHRKYNLVSSEEVATPSPFIQEVVYTAKFAMEVGGDLGKITNMITGAAGKIVKVASSKKPVQEAL